MTKMSYREKFIQMNKEAKATWIVAGILIAFWWIAGFGTAGMDYTLFQMPGWFVLSCFGVWILSIALVWLLTTKVFLDFSLEDDDETEKERE
ncbi:MAG: YhdT family protein [Synergistaceae bacterium]|nr:YhdT family protein [Synergistaceae bacterium]